MRGINHLMAPQAALSILPAACGLAPGLFQTPAMQLALQSLAPQWPAHGAGMEDLAAVLRSSWRGPQAGERAGTVSMIMS